MGRSRWGPVLAMSPIEAVAITISGFELTLRPADPGPGPDPGQGPGPDSHTNPTDCSTSGPNRDPTPDRARVDAVTGRPGGDVGAGSGSRPRAADAGSGQPSVGGMPRATSTPRRDSAGERPSSAPPTPRPGPGRGAPWSTADETYWQTYTQQLIDNLLLGITDLKLIVTLPVPHPKPTATTAAAAGRSGVGGGGGGGPRTTVPTAVVLRCRGKEGGWD